ncbi:MAG: glycerol-3-phosphate responsive antiterminator, partial [Bacillus sp. (in: Bacteria)]|nr:glycerol-3-phosphate responsive antiterminator [Bacillus sp. (in: firmicutes)]
MDKALDAPVATVFLLTGTILNIRDLVKVCRQRQKLVLVHLDFLSGVSVDEAGVQFLAKIVQPDGIISTHRAPLAAAKKSGLYT